MYPASFVTKIFFVRLRKKYASTHSVAYNFLQFSRYVYFAILQYAHFVTLKFRDFAPQIL